MKKKLLLFFFVTVLFSCDKKTSNKTLTNKLTSDHINIEGTKISLIPPHQFIKATNFQGLENVENGSTLAVLDIPAPFTETSKGMTKELLLTQGLNVKEIENLTFNNYPALFITGEQNAFGKINTKYILTFGSEKETMMLLGLVPNNLVETSKEIKTSILSSFYDIDKKINPLENVEYRLDVKGSKLVFAKSMSNSLIYTIDGISPTKSLDKTTLIVGKSFTLPNNEDLKQFSINRLQQMPIEIEKIESVNQITIDGISGIEIVAIGKNKQTSETEKLYQTLLFTESFYYMLFGSTNQNFDANINEIKKVVITFKRKNK